MAGGKKQKLVRVPVAMNQPKQGNAQSERRNDSQRGRLQRRGDTVLGSFRYHEILSPPDESICQLPKQQ
jgi:hypothetical protein